jgi:hypothetical protein
VRFFLGGDYQFLCLNFGHLGACSKEFCLFCFATLHDKKVTPEELGGLWGDVQMRTMEEWEAKAGRKALFPIQVSRVVPLPLHLLLGLMKDYLSYLVDKVRNLLNK